MSQDNGVDGNYLGMRMTLVECTASCYTVQANEVSNIQSATHMSILMTPPPQVVILLWSSLDKIDQMGPLGVPSVSKERNDITSSYGLFYCHLYQTTYISSKSRMN
jgi:hypothetical protein